MLLPSVGEACDVEVTLRGSYRVSPILVQALRTVHGVERAEQF
jgi:DNA polymerase-3 subunit alpha